VRAVENWKTEPLGRVARLTMGQSPDSRYYSEEENGLPFLQGCAEFKGRFPKHSLYCSQTKKIATVGSILFSVRAPVGRINIADRDYIIGRGLAGISGIEVDQAYLEHYVTFVEPNFRNASQGSTFEAINSSELNGWPIEHPVSKTEQAKIAEILSTVDRAIEQTEALIAKQQRIKTGLMQDLLTRGIDEHGNLRSEQTHKFKDSPIGKIPIEWSATQIIKAASLQRGHDITEDDLLDGPYPVVSSSGIIGWHRECTSSGPNVVVGRKGTIGNVHYLQQSFWAHDTSLYVTNFFGNDEKYFYYLFIHLDLARFGTKSGSPSLNRNDIHPIWIGLPEFTEQNQIANILTECDCQINSHSSNLAKIKRLKTSLMQDLLTGRKRITALLKEKESAAL
jgi:type I restriction enzyme S subunit